MNWDALHQKLVLAARQSPPDDRVPYTFEKRVMAGILARNLGAGEKDDWSAINRALWWAAATCSAVAIAMSVWTFSPDRGPNASAAPDFTDDLELTILASLDVNPVALEDPALDPELDLLW